MLGEPQAPGVPVLLVVTPCVWPPWGFLFVILSKAAEGSSRHQRGRLP